MNSSFKKLENLYGKMDKAFDKAASHYGFKCNGCKDNCCQSYFYHHTFVEKDYLLSKAGKLEADIKLSLTKNAGIYLNIISSKTHTTKEKPLCPLNKDDKCILYKARPMICRLHGIPHHLSIPGREAIKNPGCNAGNPLFNSTDYLAFDRIPFYKEMAGIEKEYKNSISKTEKIKQTIAHMLLDLP